MLNAASPHAAALNEHGARFFCFCHIVKAKELRSDVKKPFAFPPYTPMLGSGDGGGSENSARRLKCVHVARFHTACHLLAAERVGLANAFAVLVERCVN
ncbi:uncharacterized [Tachysurus ichikawai]